MYRASECPSCGNIYENNIRRCAYCGTANRNFIQEEKKTKTIFDDLRKAISVEESPKRDYSRQTKKSNSKINPIFLIILLIVFWPAAVVYIIVQLNK